jgi:L-fuconolactonase
MPDFPIIDTHVHLWDPERFRIPWLDNAGILNKRYALPEYQQSTQGIEVEGIVYVEVDVAPQLTLLEARWVAAQVHNDFSVLGIVANAPIEFGEQVRAYLDELVKISPRIKGVRRLLQGESDSAYCLQPNFVRGIQILAEYGLSFDIGVVHRQLASTAELVRRCPDVTFILNHIGKPDIKGHILDPWRDDIKALAVYPNVFCKVSGMVTEADTEHWVPDDLAPYVAYVLDAFGEDRMLFGSDWPVVLNAANYQRWIETLDALTANLSVEATHKLWNENARRCYRL